MKNVHVLPTDKPSQLWFENDNNQFIYGINSVDGIYNCKNHNIYITNDEEIKEKDFVLDDEQDVFRVLEINNKQGVLRSDGFTYVIDVCKKIILTTDLDLIKDGVQAIPDDFLEWFVNNPSCESVNVESLRKSSGYYDEKEIWYWDFLAYKIIIPKQEHNKFLSCCKSLEECYCDIKPKQETLEDLLNKKANQSSKVDLDAYANGLDDGYKLAQERIGLNNLKTLRDEKCSYITN